ncbi:MAG: hypothetical protein JHC84_17910 [Solirubrobacteraceae bacterium]|nr:hypothetical protein [Solirubrobacteraceae bacterium]
MTSASATRMAVSVGVATGVIGVVLLVAPRRVGELAGIEDDMLLRAMGVADLTLVPGLLAGRRRWPWMAARAALNLAMAARLAQESAPQARAVGAALVGVTVVDGRAAAVLRADGA